MTRQFSSNPDGARRPEQGRPFVSDRDTLVRFDPKAETFQSWPIPSGNIHAGIVRHMRPTRDGNLLIHQSSTNRIMLVTLKRPNATQ